MILFLLLCFSCCQSPFTQNEAQDSIADNISIETEKEEVSTVAQDKIVQNPDSNLNVTYSYLPVRTKEERDNFLKKTTAGNVDLILRINRIDRAYLHRVDTLVVPNVSGKDLLYYSPFPTEISFADTIKKLVVFSYRIQAFAAYEHGKLVRWGPTSLGRKDLLTPAGLQAVNWKAAKHVSSIDPTWIMPFTMNLDCNCGVAMHQYALPGKPASHKCLRLLMDDAKYLFYWVDTWIVDKKGRQLAFGTPVVVYGVYDFSQSGPWRKLPEDPEITNITTEELRTELIPFLEEIIKRQNESQEVLEKRKTKL